VNRRYLLAAVAACLIGGAALAAESSGLAAWTRGVTVAPVSPAQRHSIHSYFNTSPESPDGRFVLYYASTTPDGHRGQVILLERATGKEEVLADDLSVEDAHRAACQQWLSGGKRVAFHTVSDGGECAVHVVDLATRDVKIMATGRLLGFGQPLHDLVPLYGPHWNPGQHRGLELLDVATGRIEMTKLTPDKIRAAYPKWIAGQYGDQPISLFFPLLSPDASRVLFKLAAPAGGDFRSSDASKRVGLFGYDLKVNRFLFQQANWGHPAWHPNSREVLNTNGRVTNSDTGQLTLLPGRNRFPGSHPSYSPDGKLFTTDVQLGAEPFDGPAGSWAVVVGEVATGEFVTLHQFDNSRGARSWRVSHPHPAFSPDGRRLYFNVSDGPWTRLFVAEIGMP
jgi:Tol biopolymer transport system component